MIAASRCHSAGRFIIFRAMPYYCAVSSRTMSAMAVAMAPRGGQVISRRRARAYYGFIRLTFPFTARAARQPARLLATVRRSLSAAYRTSTRNTHISPGRSPPTSRAARRPRRRCRRQPRAAPSMMMAASRPITPPRARLAARGRGRPVAARQHINIFAFVMMARSSPPRSRHTVPLRQPASSGRKIAISFRPAA